MLSERVSGDAGRKLSLCCCYAIPAKTTTTRKNPWLGCIGREIPSFGRGLDGWFAQRSPCCRSLCMPHICRPPVSSSHSVYCALQFYTAQCIISTLSLRVERHTTGWFIPADSDKGSATIFIESNPDPRSILKRRRPDNGQIRRGGPRQAMGQKQCFNVSPSSRLFPKVLSDCIFTSCSPPIHAQDWCLAVKGFHFQISTSGTRRIPGNQLSFRGNACISYFYPCRLVMSLNSSCLSDHSSHWRWWYILIN